MLREGFIPSQGEKNESNGRSPLPSSEVVEEENKPDNHACDSNNASCHMLKVNLPPQTQDKINSIECDKQLQLQEEKQESNTNKPIFFNDSTSCDLHQKQQQQEPSPTCKIDSHTPQINNNDNSTIDPSTYNQQQQYDSKKNNVPLWGPKEFQPVTPSQCHTQPDSISSVEADREEQLALQEVLAEIKKVNGSQIALNFAIETAYNKSSQIRDYLKDQKLTPRDSRKVRNLSTKIIRHENIKIIKHKRQLIVKWGENESDELKAESNCNDNAGSDIQNKKEGDVVQ